MTPPTPSIEPVAKSLRAPTMSLAFFIEAGIHGPIEPELAIAEAAKQMPDYSGIRTSDGILNAHFSHNHKTGLQSTKGPSESATGTTLFRFHDPPPVFSLALLRQLHLLEWSGLFKPLQSTLDDLATITGEDRLLLWSSVHLAHVEIRMPDLLAARAAKSTRLVVWLSTWLFMFRSLAQCSAQDQVEAMSFKLSIRDDQVKVVSITTTGASSVQVSVKLHAELLEVRGLDGLPDLKVAVGETMALKTWCHYEMRDETELAELIA